MEAIVLAGGLGTRLAHVVADVPKPMALVSGTPFLQHVLDHLVQQGVSHIVLAVGYKKEAITSYFQNSYRGVPISYSVEESLLLTGGAIKQALAYCREDPVFIINGDTLFDVDYAQMMAAHQAAHADISIAVKPMEQVGRYGRVAFDQDMRVQSFHEKGFCEKVAINGGVYLLQRGVVDAITANKFSFEKDVMEDHPAGKRIFACPSAGYFIDIGVPEDYEKAQKDFQERR